METIFENTITTMDRRINFAKEWVPSVVRAVHLSQDLLNAVLVNDITKIEDFGLPTDLVEIVKVWSLSGPEMLVTTAHNAEMLIWNCASEFRLNVFLQELLSTSKIFIMPEHIRIPMLDTIPINHFSVRSAFSIHPFNPNKASIPLSTFDLLLEKWNSDISIKLFTDAILAVISEELNIFRTSNITHFEAIGINSNGILRNLIADEIKQRFIELRRLALAAEEKTNIEIREKGITSEDLRKNLFLARFQQGIFFQLFPEKADTNLFPDGLNSLDSHWLKLIRWTLQELISLRGSKVISDICKPGEILGIVRFEDLSEQFKGNVPCFQTVSPMIFTVDERNQLALKFPNSSIITLDDHDVQHIISHIIPFSKLELLAQTAGMHTLHFGSEHGTRVKVIETLGLSGNAATLAQNLQVGLDTMGGSDVIRLSGRGIPITLAFLMFSNEQLREIIIDSVNLAAPLNLEIHDLKKLFTRSLSISVMKKLSQQ